MANNTAPWMGARPCTPDMLPVILKREAHDCIYIAAGAITANALAFWAQSNIRLLHGAELAMLLR